MHTIHTKASELKHQREVKRHKWKQDNEDNRGSALENVHSTTGDKRSSFSHAKNKPTSHHKTTNTITVSINTNLNSSSIGCNARNETKQSFTNQCFQKQNFQKNRLQRLLNVFSIFLDL